MYPQVCLVFLCLGLPLVPACARAQPSSTAAEPPLIEDRPLAIRAIRASATEAPRYSQVELSIDLQGRYANPFDAAEIALDGLVTTPSGRRIVVPGFYTQGYSRRLEGDLEQMTPVGKPGWRLRVNASETGRYQVIAAARDRTGKRVTSRPVTFTAVPSTRPGFIRRSPRSARYFVFDDGRAYVPIGANVCWGNSRGTFNYDRWFARYAAADSNYARLWLGPTWTTFGVDRQGIGKIDLANAWRIDHVLGLAEKHGLYLMLCFDSYNELRYEKDGAHPFWEQTPHNASNGGPLREPGEFWTHPEMERHYRNRIRYLVARYGASPHVMAWEFWNEVDIVSPGAWNEKQVVAWHTRMARYLRGLDPYDHLITTSFSGSSGKEAIDRLPELDFIQTHTYGARDVTGELLARQQTKSAYGKPHFVGECGIGEQDERDRQGTYLHNALWSGLFSGGAGTGMLWWWDNHIDPNGLYSQFAALARFMRDVDPVRLELQPTTEARLAYATTPSTLPLADLEIPANDRSWSASPANRPTQVWVDRDGGLRVDAALSGLLHGVKNHPALHNPVTFHLDLPRATQLVVQVSGVSGYGGGRLLARRNGELVLDRDMLDPDGGEKTETLHQYDGAYSIQVPPGPQTLVIENQGTDWMSVGYLLKDGRTAAQPTLRVLALTGPEAAVAWVQNPQHEWYRTLVLKETPRPVPATTLELRELKAGRYLVVLWDTYRGIELRRLSLQTESGTLSVPLPAVEKDLAVKATRQPETLDARR